MEGYIYLLESKDKKRHYLGASSDVEKRILEHNKGTTKSTRNKGPWYLLATWKIPTIEEAKKIEKEIKKMKKMLTIEYISFKIENKKRVIDHSKPYLSMR